MIRIKGEVDRVDLDRDRGNILVVDRDEARAKGRVMDKVLDKGNNVVIDQLELQSSKVQLVHHQEELMVKI